MTPEEAAVVNKLRGQYDSIHDNLDLLLEACGDDDVMKRQLGDAMQEALDNFIEAQNRILGQSQSEIQKINSAADQASAQIKNALQDLKDIKSTLNTLTTVVKSVAIAIAALPSI